MTKFATMAWNSKVAGLALVVLAGLCGEAARADNVVGQPIYAQNNGTRPIWVAARYMPAGRAGYVTDGYWRLDPGQRTLICYNNAVYVYFFARDDLGRVNRGSGAPIQATVRGEVVNMYGENTGNDFNPRVITFFDN
jgi:hypothetical protein